MTERQAERKETLRILGLDSYADYLQTDLWKRIRARIYVRANGVCEACRKRAPSAIHHRSYDLKTMLGECDKMLKAVCGVCHLRFHNYSWKAPNPIKVERRRIKREFETWVANGGALAVKELSPRLIRKGE